MIEKLGPEARAELQVGLFTPTAARQLVRLPRQAQILDLVRREALSTNELTGIVDLWVECPAASSNSTFFNIHAKRWLRNGVDLPSRDPRLSSGNRIFEQLGGLLGNSPAWKSGWRIRAAPESRQDRRILVPI